MQQHLGDIKANTVFYFIASDGNQLKLLKDMNCEEPSMPSLKQLSWSMTMDYLKHQPALNTGLILFFLEGVFSILKSITRKPHFSQFRNHDFSLQWTTQVNFSSDMSSLACKKINSASEKKKKTQLFKALCFVLWHYKRHEMGIVYLVFNKIRKKYSKEICEGD